MNKSMRRSSVSNNTWYKSLSAGNTPLGTYEHLASINVTNAGVSTLTFSSIPQGYGHLQVRYHGKTTTTASSLNIRLNDIAIEIYSNHSVEARGSTVISSNSVLRQDIALLNAVATSATSGRSSPGIIDILDYANPSKNTVVRAIYGHAFASSPNPIVIASGLLNDTQSITSITFSVPGTTFSTTPVARFSLYGIRG